jgi:hypothetical protein
MGRKVKINPVFFFLLLCSLASGCAFPLASGSDVLTGLVYTRIKVPMSIKLNNTPNEIVIDASGKVIRIKEPITGYGIYAEFNSNAIGDIARQYGVETVYYADHEIFNILGIWRHDKVIIYGK